MKTPRTSDFIFPYSPLVASVVISFMNVIAKMPTGRARNPAKDVSGMTASTSAARHAQKSIREYHQKSPSLVWSLRNTRILHHFYCMITKALDCFSYFTFTERDGFVVYYAHKENQKLQVEAKEEK